ncbi:DUF2807 domain-containing protein [bacterium]|nr:DUF2807 domain-containing protein [bacterium]
MVLKNSIKTLLTVFLLFASFSCSRHCLRGSGNVVRKDYRTSEFHIINFKGIGDLHVNQGKEHSIIVESEENLLKLLSIEVSNHILTVKTEEVCIRNTKPFKIFVTTPELREVNVDGPGTFNFDSPFKTRDLKLFLNSPGSINSVYELNSNYLQVVNNGPGSINLNILAQDFQSSLNGPGNLYLEGFAVSHKVSISGSGDLEAFKLRTDRTSINIGGSGKARIQATEILSALITGSGNIYYKGEPKNVQKQISGSGDVIKVD